MKTKKFSKKLVLKKQTVSHLSSEEMTKQKGGTDTNYMCTSICTMQTVCPTQCVYTFCIDC